MNKSAVKKYAFPFILIIIGFGLVSLAMALFSEISENVVNQEIRVIDHAVTDILLYIFPPGVNNAMVFITELGSVWFISLISLVVILYLWFRERDKWGILFFLIAIGGGGLLILILKLYYQIDRPSINVDIDAIGYSFPSGHAMGSLILYGFIVYLIIRGGLSRRIKAVLSTALLFLSILIAVSRVYLSAHYPSDIVAGQAGGFAWLLVCIISLEGYKWTTRNNFKPLRMIGKLLESLYKRFF